MELHKTAYLFPLGRWVARGTAPIMDGSWNMVWVFVQWDLNPTTTQQQTNQYESQIQQEQAFSESLLWVRL